MGDGGDGEIAAAHDDHGADGEAARSRTRAQQQTQSWVELLFGGRVQPGRSRSGIPPSGTNTADCVGTTPDRQEQLGRYFRAALLILSADFNALPQVDADSLSKAKIAMSQVRLAQFLSCYR